MKKLSCSLLTATILVVASPALASLYGSEQQHDEARLHALLSATWECGADNLTLAGRNRCVDERMSELVREARFAPPLFDRTYDEFSSVWEQALLGSESSGSAHDARFMLAYVPPDTDGDGVDDLADACPYAPGPIDFMGYPTPTSDPDRLGCNAVSCTPWIGCPLPIRECRTCSARNPVTGQLDVWSEERNL